MITPTASVPPIGYTRIGIIFWSGPRTGIRLSWLTTNPASNPAIRPPRNPEPTATAMRPPTTPGVMPGRSAMA